MHEICRSGHIGIAALCFALGASALTRSSPGKTAIDVAKAHGHALLAHHLAVWSLVKRELSLSPAVAVRFGSAAIQLKPGVPVLEAAKYAAELYSTGAKLPASNIPQLVDYFNDNIFAPSSELGVGEGAGSGEPLVTSALVELPLEATSGGTAPEGQSHWCPLPAGVAEAKENVALGEVAAGGGARPQRSNSAAAVSRANEGAALGEELRGVLCAECGAAATPVLTAGYPASTPEGPIIAGLRGQLRQTMAENQIWKRRALHAEAEAAANAERAMRAEAAAARERVNNSRLCGVVEYLKAKVAAVTADGAEKAAKLRISLERAFEENHALLAGKLGEKPRWP